MSINFKWFPRKKALIGKSDLVYGIKIDLKEMLRKRSVGVNVKNYLPCAGITLSRFYGYYLSFPL